MLGGRGGGARGGGAGARRQPLGSRARAFPPRPLLLRASRLPPPPHSEGPGVPGLPPSSQVSRPGRGEGRPGGAPSLGLSPVQVAAPQARPLWWSEVTRPSSAFGPVTAVRCCCGAGSCCCVQSAVCSLGSPSPEGSTLHPRKVSAARG